MKTKEKGRQGKAEERKEKKDKKEFVRILSRAWERENVRFSREDYKKYLEWLDYLEKCEDSLGLNRKEIKALYFYIHKTIHAYSQKIRANRYIDKESLTALNNIYFIMEYVFLYQSGMVAIYLLLELFYSIIETEENDLERMEYLLQFYVESEVLNRLCFYLSYFYNFKCEQQIIDSFLSKIQFTKHYPLFFNTLYQMI